MNSTAVASSVLDAPKRPTRASAKGGGPVVQLEISPDKKFVTIGGVTVPRYDCPPEWQFLVPEAEVYEPQGHELTGLAAAYKNHLSMLFYGPTGSGKNGLLRWFAHMTNRPLFLLSMAEGTGIDQFIGSVVPVPAKDAHGFTVEFRHGALPLAIKSGGILVLDELNAADERALMRLHDFLATGSRLTIYEDPANDGKVISPITDTGQHNGFMVVATANPADTGQYAGTKVLNEATLDRFLVLEVDYLGVSNPEKEAEVVAAQTGVNVSKTRRLVKVFNELRKRARMTDAEIAAQGKGAKPLYVTASTRRLIQVATLSKDLPIMRAVEIGYTNKINRDDRPVVHKLFLDEFGSDGIA